MAYVKGVSALIIFNVEKGKIVREIKIDEVDAMSYPAWSPKESIIVFTGLKYGVSDLYLYNLDNDELQNITNDPFCNLQPSWDRAGEEIFYVTDAPDPLQERYLTTQYNIAKLHLNTLKKAVFSTFSGSKNVNPVVGNDASKVFFLSDRDGTRNLYLFDVRKNIIEQLTFYPTGITGITPLAPALNISKNELYYNMLWEGEFSIVRTNINQIQKTAVEVDDRKVDLYTSRLMPYSKYPSIVDQNLTAKIVVLPEEPDSFLYGACKSKI